MEVILAVAKEEETRVLPGTLKHEIRIMKAAGYLSDLDGGESIRAVREQVCKEWNDWVQVKAVFEWSEKHVALFNLIRD